MWQMSSVGPIFGQAHHFLYYNPESQNIQNLDLKKLLIKYIKYLIIS